MSLLQEHHSGSSPIWHVLPQSAVLRDFAEAAANTSDTQEGDTHLTGALADAPADFTCLQSHRLSTISQQAHRRVNGHLLPLCLLSQPHSLARADNCRGEAQSPSSSVQDYIYIILSWSMDGRVADPHSASF